MSSAENITDVDRAKNRSIVEDIIFTVVSMALLYASIGLPFWLKLALITGEKGFYLDQIKFGHLMPHWFVENGTNFNLGLFVLIIPVSIALHTIEYYALSPIALKAINHFFSITGDIKKSVRNVSFLFLSLLVSGFTLYLLFQKLELYQALIAPFVVAIFAWLYIANSSSRK